MMSSRLVKKIQATQVRSIMRPTLEPTLSTEETERMMQVAARFRTAIDLRRSGLTPQEVSRLEFLRWTLDRRGERLN